jgi:DNA polymerase-4
VRVEGITAADNVSHQLELDERSVGRRDAELASDRAAQRFGAGAVRPATLVGGGASERHTKVTGGPGRELTRDPARRQSARGIRSVDQV